MTKTWLDFLDEVRAIAQMGLSYAQNPYDVERYTRLLALSAEKYSEMSGLESAEILNRFRVDMGYVTPKLGCAGAVFNDDGQILLVRRSDNGTWGLPGGWCESQEAPETSIQRELLEETGLEVGVKGLIDVFSRTPSMYGEPHATASLLYHCEMRGGTLTPSHETPEVGFYDPATIEHWHIDHHRRVVRALAWWKNQQRV